MRRAWLVAMVCAGVAASACAQRGGARGGGGGFSGHASSGPSIGMSRGGGFSSGRSGFPGGAGFSSAPRSGFASSRSFAGTQRGFSQHAFSQLGARPSFYNRRPGYGGTYGLNRNRESYGRGLGGYGLGAWIAPEYLAYPDDFGEDDGAGYGDSGGYVDQGVGPRVAGPEPGPETGPEPYPQEAPYAGPGDPGTPYAAPVARRSRQQLTPEEAVTLIFKDGRPPEQVHNYMLTRTTLYVTDARRREIPVESLDLVATVKANRAAGVDFALPVEVH